MSFSSFCFFFIVPVGLVFFLVVLVRAGGMGLDADGGAEDEGACRCLRRDGKGLRKQADCLLGKKKRTR